MGKLTEAEILAQIPAATAAANAERKRGLLADSVRYDSTTHRFLFELTNGVLLGVPVTHLRGLERATAAQLAEAVVTPSGGGLHIESLDADYDIPGIVQTTIGRPADARAFASAGGRVTSEAKARSARANGAKGGRPRKVAVDALTSGAPPRRRARSALSTGTLTPLVTMLSPCRCIASI